MSYEERINHLKDEFSKTSSKLRIADVEGSHTDTCTKCTAKPIVKEHLCDDCYESHNEWLAELSAPKQDDDQWYTLYESERPSLRKKLHKTVLDGLDKRLEQSINESGDNSGRINN